MRDSEIVEAIVAGDPEGLATAYDTYAAPLYTYCKAVLREPADAADAVQDTFVVAASRLGGLRDRDRLRPWLYAVARNECRRRLRARATTSALEEAPEATDEQADVSADAERAELQALMRAAVLGLNPTEQEVVELQLRQGLDAGEIADVLDVSRNHAHALVSRARNQLEVCLGVLLVARTGREACAELDTLLEGWDGQLNPLLRKRLNRHIDRCAICSDRRRVELAPAMLLGIAPLAAAVAARTPAGLREQVLHMASSNSPEAVAHRATVASRTTQFGQHGFPKTTGSAKAHFWHARSAQAAAAIAAAAAVISIVAVALSGGGGPHRAEAGGPGAGPSGAASSGSNVAPSPGTSGSGTNPRSSSGSASGRPGLVGQIRPGTSGQSSSGVTSGSSPGSSPTGQGTGPSSPSSPSSGQSSSPASTPPSSSHPTSPAPTTPAPTTPAPKTSSPPPPPPRPGTLTVAPTSILLSTLGGTQITITAVGGPVSWSISEPSTLLGSLNVAPSAGTLQAGQSATVTISVSTLLSLDTVLTVNPGGHSITVVLGLL